MSKRSPQKRNARSKEKAKQLRRQRGMSPLSRLVGGPNVEGIECWAHYDGVDERLVSFMVFRAVRGAGSAVACFLVDFDCIGLKDAFYRLDVPLQETLQRYRARAADEGTRFARVDVAEVRATVGGAVRWTREHDFRFPRDWQRCMKFLGTEVDTQGADISGFGVEGGALHYVGRESDLEQRLIGETLEEFLEREDVTYEFMDGAWEQFDAEAVPEDEFEEDLEEEFADEEDGEGDPRAEAEKVVLSLARSMERDMRKWCKANNRPVPRKLEDATQVRALAIFKVVNERKFDALRENVERVAQEIMMDAEDLALRAEMQTAYGALMEYLLSLPPRTGPEYEFDEDNETELDAEEAAEALAESADIMRGKMVEAIRRWCQEKAIMAHPALEDGVRLTLEAMTHGMADPDDEDAADRAARSRRQLLDLETPERRAELLAAIEQVDAFMSGFDSAGDMQTALGLDEEE